MGQKQLFELAENVRKCTACPLWKGRLLAVPGEGPADAKIMIVGEAPGAEEDRLGIPFVGRAGKLLDELLATNGFNREDIFITNSVRCRPPKNRDPDKQELKACKHWLDEQISVIKPDLIIILGRIALKNLLGKDKISDIHGEIIFQDQQKYFVTYHPSAGIRMVKWKKLLEEDFEKLKKLKF
ncbi:MAG: uracil-DNA glycosylase [Candidatus Woesearchaeota archaeon]